MCQRLQCALEEKVLAHNEMENKSAEMRLKMANLSLELRKTKSAVEVGDFSCRMHTYLCAGMPLCIEQVEVDKQVSEPVQAIEGAWKKKETDLMAELQKVQEHVQLLELQALENEHAKKSDSRGTRETKDRLALVEAELDQHETQMKKRENSWTARIQELCLQFKAERLRADAIQVLHQ